VEEGFCSQTLVLKVLGLEILHVEAAQRGSAALATATAWKVCTKVQRATSSEEPQEPQPRGQTSIDASAVGTEEKDEKGAVAPAVS